MKDISFIPAQRDVPLIISTVCIYCGSANGVAEHFVKIAQDAATALAKQKIRLVYGGGHVGLMGKIADAAIAAGGEVIGIIPEHIKAKEVQHNGLTKLHVVADMHTRKRMMAEYADAFVVLPGGLGTMDEVFEIITWKKLGLHNRPVIMFNHQGFWNPFLALYDHLIAEGFAQTSDRALFSVAENTHEMFEQLRATNAPPIGVLSGRM